MKSLYRTLAVLALLSLAALACSLTNKTPDDSAASSDEAASNPALLFEDDFADTSSGWDRFNDENAITDYLEGEYQIKVNETSMFNWANPGKTFGDVVVEVDARKADGPDGDATIICRYVDETNFYMLGITTDGFYGIVKYKDGEDTLLGSDAYQESSSIKTDATNHLRAECVGDRLTLYVNGEILADVNDSDFTNGDVGLASGTYEEAGTDIRFDNFEVYRP